MGPREGLYTPRNFDIFMTEQKGISIGSFDSGDFGEGFANLYHVNGVTVKYHGEQDDGTKKDHGVAVTLYGEESSIDQLAHRILEEARKQKSSLQLQ